MQLEKQIQAELTKLDRDLFLDKDNYHGAIMYSVKYNVGSGHPPLRVLDWHSGNKALPLSAGIVDRVKSFEGDITSAIAEVKRNNEAKKLAAREDMLEIFGTIEDEFTKSSKVLHRSGPWKIGSDVTAYKAPEGLRKPKS